MQNVTKRVEVVGKATGLDALKSKLDGVAVAQDKVTASGRKMSIEEQRIEAANLRLVASSTKLSIAQKRLNDLMAQGPQPMDQLGRATAQLATAEAQVVNASAGVAAARKRAAIATVTATSALQANTVAANANVAAHRKSNFAVGNLAAQFNDIGVMFAYQDPLQLALQQGTQIGQIFTQAGGSVQSAGRLMASAFAQVVSPVNLLTIGVIAGAAALFQWGMKAFSASEELEGLEKRMQSAQEAASGLRLELRELRLGVSSQELAILDAISEKMKAVADAQERLENTSGRSKKGVSAILKDEQEALASLQNQLTELQRMNAERETLKKLTGETADAERLLGEQMAVSTSNAEKFERVANLLKSGVSATTIEAIELAGIDLSSPIISAADASKILHIGLSDSQIAAIELSGTSIAGPIREAADEAARLAENMFLASRVGLREDLRDEDALFSQSVIPDAGDRAGQRQSLSNLTRMTAPKRTSSRMSPGQRAAQNAAREIEREQEAIQSLIASMQTEIALVGATALQREVSNNTRRLGASATQEQISQVIELTETLHNQQEAWAGTQEAQGFFASSFSGAINGLIEGTSSVKDVVNELASSFINAAAQAALLGQGPLASIFGGGSGIFGSLLGFAGGTSYAPGGMAMVGERGPEIVHLPRGAKVAPNHDLGRYSRGSAANQNGGKTIIEVRLSPDLEQRILQQAGDQSVQVVRASQGQTVKSAISGAQRSFSTQPRRWQG